MSFRNVPTSLLHPEMPFDPSDIWAGFGVDAGLIAFDTGIPALGPYVITEGRLCNSLLIEGREFLPVFSETEGRISWVLMGEVSAVWVYYTQKFGWVYIAGKYPGYIPEETEESAGLYVGDYFFSGSLPAPGDGNISHFEPRGAYRGGSSTGIDVQFYFPRWKNALRSGRYAAAGGIGEDKRLPVFGIPIWKDDSGSLYPRSRLKIDGFYRYGEIHHDGGKWLIGSAGDASGWYEGNEPDEEQTVTFRFCRPEDSEVAGEDRFITFLRYEAGEEKAECFWGEVAIWR